MGLQYRTAAIAGMTTQFVWGFMEIMVFRAFYAADPAAFPMSFEATASYIWLQQALLLLFAAWLIEQCGWKGRRSGGAAVYEKQPLVIVNYTGEAYPEEIIGLEKRIIASVKTKFGIELHPEVEHI